MITFVANNGDHNNTDYKSNQNDSNYEIYYDTYPFKRNGCF